MDAGSAAPSFASTLSVATPTDADNPAATLTLGASPVAPGDPLPSDTQHRTNGHSTVWTTVGLCALLLCAIFSVLSIWCLKRRYPDPFKKARTTGTASSGGFIGSAACGANSTTTSESTMPGHLQYMDMGKRKEVK